MTLHRCPGALQLEEVYGEVFRVLKPGGFFASYEWVSTKLYDSNNPEHVRIMDEINYGNGLPVSSGCRGDKNLGHLGMLLC